jgi:hypothetical protein
MSAMPAQRGHRVLSGQPCSVAVELDVFGKDEVRMDFAARMFGCVMCARKCSFPSYKVLQIFADPLEHQLGENGQENARRLRTTLVFPVRATSRVFEYDLETFELGQKQVTIDSGEKYSERGMS